MGGLGKTTLTSKIYNLPTVQDCFEARAWVSISQQFQPKDVFQGILSQLSNQGGVQGEDELVRRLYQVQIKKRCLVVLDDIWEVDDWNMLSCAFPIAEAAGCKVLLTSRYDNIASSSMGYVHKLGCLSEDEGWELLQRIALPIHYSPELITTESKLLEAKGREIVRKCGCLPLGISVIGGILRQKKSSSEWEKVKKNIESYLKQRGGVGKDSKIMQILDLSYNVLPYNLKPCFLYLGCFQEDRDIYTQDLYLLWMAEGLISSEDKGRGETLRDVAERYLCELENRCMVQVKVDEGSMYNRFVSCHLHDLMRDLCLSKGKEEEVVEVVDTQRQTENIGSSLGRTRRLAVHMGKLEDLQLVSGRRNQNLRSLLLLENTYSSSFVGYKTVSIDFGMFTSLKTLMLEGCQFQNRKPPKGIEKLILLKHLSLFSSYVDELPQSISKLPCLQSLDLRTPRMVLPSVINSTGRLRHLFLPKLIPRIVGGGKLKLDGLNELETLSGFNSQSLDFSHVHKLVNLRELSGIIYDKDSLFMIIHHISNHQDQFRETSFTIESSCIMNSEQGSDQLYKMLMCHSLVKLHIKCRVRKLPAYEPQMCQNLISLTLEECGMEEDPMETLEKLPMLQKLNLEGSFVRGEMVCRSGGFPQLRTLFLVNLFNLVEWRVEERAMPNLSYLRIQHCRNLKMIPQGLRFITTLQRMTIDRMPPEFMDRIRIVHGEAGEDYDIIKHIPALIFL